MTMCICEKQRKGIKNRFFHCIICFFLIYYIGILRSAQYDTRRIDRVAKELAWKASKV